MRLTLRTLLAYLDDTLEPAEIKPIGQKVAESDAAQELIARIKLVTRRRRLTTPPDGGTGQRFDANVVADYLDNELSAEQVAEIEKICLESDVHLAEIAACHQILTLVLGEPALVPPTAKRRMYALVHGKESKATRKVVATAAATPSADGARTDADDPLAGLPLFQKAPWLRWAVPVAAVVLLAILGVVLFSNLSGDGNGRRIARNEEKADTDKETKPVDSGEKPGDNETKPGDGDKDPKETKPEETKPTETKDNDTKPDNGGTKPAETVKTPPAIIKPSMEQAPLGRFTSRGEVLVQRPGEAAGWERLPIDGVIHGGRPLVSLPGYRSEVLLDKKVHLLLWGNVPEFLPQRPQLRESAVVLHKSDDRDLDFTLRRGRVYVSNRKEKDPARVRLRFWKEEVWDLTLEEPDTTIGVELVSFYLPQTFLGGEDPFVQVVLNVIKGRASLKVEHRRTFGDLRPSPSASLVVWDNKGQGLRPPVPVHPSAKQFWDMDPPRPEDERLQRVANAIQVAKEELATQLTKPDKKVAVALLESLDGTSLARRVLAVRCLGAIGAVESLLDALGNENPDRGAVRGQAIEALQDWVSRGAGQVKRLYDPQTRTGLLLDRNYRRLEAETFRELLYGPSAEAWRRPETFEVMIGYLRHPKLAIREMAIRHLYVFAPADEMPDYNPAAGVDARQRGYDQWKKLLDDGKLPPPLPKQSPPSGM